jgi:hypothetical protein
METFTLNTFLVWIISGGATVIARLIIARIPVMQQELTESERSAVTVLVSVALITAAFLGAVAAGYIPEPQTGLQWFEALFVPVATAIGIPALMTTTMQVKEARYNKRESISATTLYPKANKLFGIRW